MMASTWKSLLEPYLASSVERYNGDMDMHCPIHGDARRSATVNFRTGEWYCNACEEGGSLHGLIQRRSSWLPVPEPTHSSMVTDSEPLPDEARIDGWSSALVANESALEYLLTKRGLTMDTIMRFGIGWHSERYTFPVYDEKGKLANIRMLSLTKDSKWVNWPGAGSPPRLYPLSVFLDDPNQILVAEGELDTLLSIQHEVPAVTSTGGAKSMGRFRAEWTQRLTGKQVYICFDCDQEGRQSARKASEQLKDAATTSIIELPYPMGSKKDLTDFWLEEGTADELFKLARSSKKRSLKVNYREVEYDSLRRGKMEGRPVLVEGTIAGVFNTQLLLPISLKGSCLQDWDPKRCAVCPLGAMNGNMTVQTENNHKLRFELLGLGSDKARERLYKEAMGVPVNCSKVDIKPEHITAWECEIRNGSNLSEESYPLLLRFDAKPPLLNSPYKFNGRVRPSPKGQRAVFDADGCTPTRADLDTFVPTDAGIQNAHAWVKSLTGTPDQKLEQVAALLEEHVTKIFGQRLLHLAMDLVYHSVVGFSFGETKPMRGWMEALAVGETRSGKTTAAKRIIDLYARGHYETVENASIAGLMYGVEKRGGLSGAGSWQASIGILPLNDRGLVALDEAQGLTHEQIGQMSSMRSDGVVQITKMRQVTCDARVRLVWLANGRRNRYASGIDCLQDQMGQAEDLARVDIPIYIHEGEEWRKAKESYGGLDDETSAVLRWIVLWAWSRTSEQIKWNPKAVNAVWDLADSLSEQFSVTDYPVFAKNEAHVRLARMATALAARLFSTLNGVNVLVQQQHVLAAYNLYERFLGEESLDLAGLKTEAIQREEAGKTEADQWLELLRNAPVELAEKCASGQFSSHSMRGDWVVAIMNQASGIKASYWRNGDYLISPWAQTIAKEYVRRS